MSDAPSPSETMGVAPPTLVPGMRPDAYVERAEPWRGLPAGADPKSFERAEPWRGLPPGTDPKSFEQPLANDPLAIPPEAAQVIKVIRAAEGTAQGEGFVLYGGQPFIPGKQHPADTGWQGGIGPTGQPTHAAGTGQWQPASWHDEAKRIAALGVEPDFGDFKQQNWAMWDRASRIYKDKVGRDLAEDVRTKQVDYSKLGQEWAGLLRQQGPTLGDQWGGWSEQTRDLLKQRGAANDATASQLRGTLAEYQRQANAAPEGSKERDEAIAESRRLSHQLQNFMADIARHPPAEKPVDAFANFGSAATIFGLIGGLFARRHLTAALSAAGTAMQAINQNNHQQFENQMRVWQQETTLAMNMASRQQAELRALIEDKRMAVDEKNSRLGNLIAEAGMAKSIGGLSTDTLDGAIALYTKQAEIQQRLMHDYALLHRQMYSGYQILTDPTKKDEAGNPIQYMMRPGDPSSAVTMEGQPYTPGGAQHIAGPRSAGAGKPEDIQALDAKGKQIYTGKATYDPATKSYTPIGWDHPLPNDAVINKAPTAGNRIQPQVQRLIGAGSQMEAHLKNLSGMPIDASVGPFMGLEAKTPDSMTTALLRTATREVVSTDAQQAMQVEFIGISRQIAALDSQGAAQGLVGLAHQAEGYAPLPTDSKATVMRKYASLRQVVEQAMKAIESSGTANADQKAGAAEIMGSIKQSIPWTVEDMNKLQFGGNPEKAAREIGIKILEQGGVKDGETSSSATSPLRPASPDDVDKLPAGSFYIDPRDPQHVRQK